ncbi:hypothetical protein VTH82DRAFT_5428 [Thermothelomyces myriococcoides]
MFSHNSTRLLLVQERILVPPGERLPHVVLGRSSRGRVTKPASYETAQSISIIMENLGVPCHKFIEASRRIATIAGEEEGKKVLEMAQRICALSDDLSVARSRLAVQESEPAERPGSLSLTTPSTNVHTRRARADADKVARDVAHQECLARVAEFHRANCVKEVSDDLIISSSCYEKEAREAEKSEHAPGRMRKLLAQVSSLSTDLPEGIYVRHGESRLDVLKVLIIGPADTPYEHGLFEFDLFCGSDFPQRPPKMFFRTTGGGRVRFNPNLYNTGKICFSLLGTWDGQPWEPDCSSLLQLLVSIQAMIFNDQPYYNEPGFEYHNDPARVQAYNRNIEYLTVRQFPAVLSHLQSSITNHIQSLMPLDVLSNSASPFVPDDLSFYTTPEPSPPSPCQSPPEEDDPIFGDVIREHFKLKAGMIMEKARSWENQTGKEPGIGEAVASLEGHLKRHGFLN